MSPANSAGAGWHPDAVALLGCPVCGAELDVMERSLLCGTGHNFDIARYGYASLLTGAATKVLGDTAEMLAARDAFQQAGHFAPIADAVTDAVLDTAVDTAAARIAEVGAGTGYYLAEILNAIPDAVAVGLDIAKPAARRCAKAHPRAIAVIADTWRGIPIQTGVLTHVLSIFAPRNASETHRVLVEDGTFIVVTPTPRHLAELVGPLGMVSVDADKPRRLADSPTTGFDRLDRTTVEYRMPLTHDDIEHVVAMGPSAFHHTALERAARIATLPPSWTSPRQ